MSQKVPKMANFNFSEIKIESYDGSDEIEKEIGEINFDTDEEQEVPDELIKMETKKEIIEDEIFETKPAQRLATAPVLNKNGKPKRKLSPEHLEKLKVAREKAYASKGRKKIERQENKKLELEEKELLQQQKVKRVRKLKEEVESDEEPKKKSSPVGVTTFTKQDLEQAQYDAILKYDALRKQQKKEKKEKEMVEAGKKKMINNINRAVGNPPANYGARSETGQLYNRFHGCY